ncbi:MAG: exodeoxyribonuclease VII small subunit [Eubacterium sp.]|nr:exodeoxyribonuclease VII small subunit [Eubacterium sp.]
MALTENNTEKNEQAEELSLEESMQLLDQMTRKMESREISLEESFQLYKQGMDLLKSCSEKIDRVEKKMQVIRGDGNLEDF